MKSFGSSIHNRTEEILAQSGSVPLGNAGPDTFCHCKVLLILKEKKSKQSVKCV